MSEEKETHFPGKITSWQTKSEAVQIMEEKYPEMTKEFWKICGEQYETFCKKMLNYGTNNILLGGNIDNDEDVKMSLAGISIRVFDKVNRLINLTVKNTPDVVNESVLDTYQDLSVYGIIAQLINRKKWGK